jgi:predicted DNA-binding protein (UPF0251 family)
MGRQKKPRYCQQFSGFNLFKPSGIPLSQIEIAEVALDELEAMRLCDFEGHDQQQAAQEMGISRGTIQRLLYSGRRKVIDALMHGKALAVQESTHVVVRQPGPRRHGRGRGRGRRAL